MIFKEYLQELERAQTDRRIGRQENRLQLNKQFLTLLECVKNSDKLLL